MTTPGGAPIDETQRVRLTGVQALARLPLEIIRSERRAGRNTAGFISGYPGSPLAGYDLELHRRRKELDEAGIAFQPGVNEELAATAVQGSQLAAAAPDCTVDGVIGFWYGKSPGLDRATDAIRHNNMMGVPANGGALIFIGDDGSAKSSTVAGASERLLADLGIPVLYPADPQQVLDLGLHAAVMSRASGLWVALKISTDVADGSATVDISPDRVIPIPPERIVNHQVTARLLPQLILALERSRDTERRQAAIDYAARNQLDVIGHHGDGDRIGIIAAGPTYLHVREALRRMKLDDAELTASGLRLLQLAMIEPIEPATLRRFASGLREIIVVEDKRPFIETAVRDALYGDPEAPVVVGKRNRGTAPLFPFEGELTADIIAPILARLLADRGGFPAAESWLAEHHARSALPQLPLLARSPYFCSGCPHNSSTKVPDGSLVGAGIGCHGMVVMMDDQLVGSVTGFTQMGGEGAQWIGMSPFVPQTHLLQNLGDGTFHHSGSLAIRAAVAAGSNITYKVLYNSAVAMTGGQHAEGALGVGDLARSLLAEGVTRIIVTTEDPHRYRRGDLPPGVQCWQRNRLEEAQRQLANTAGVTVLIHDQECAAELRRKRKRGLAATPKQRVMINERVCEGCGDCGLKSNCLSVQPIETEFGRKTQIDQSSCNYDYSCLKGDCPAFMTIVPAGPKLGAASAHLDIGDLPEPPPIAQAPHTTRMTGIGGTGVVTVAQTLAMAATLAGKYVRSLDQTGLAQKGGAVVSDIKILDHPTLEANRAGEGQCDLYLGCDLLVAADPRYLRSADPERTVAVVSMTAVPTGRMVTDVRSAFPATDEVTAPILSATRGGDAVLLDARALSTTLFGQDQFANMLLLGAAYQGGRLPLRSEHIEEAIRSGGVKVEENLQAFRRGRQYVAAPADLASALAEPHESHSDRPLSARAQAIVALVRTSPDSELARRVSLRVDDLIRYQSASYAKQYAEFVESVRDREAVQVPGGGERLAEAVSRYLHKLMAYKDEYEVPRLLLDDAADDRARRRFGSLSQVSYKLHPPFLRALGMRRKITLGPWVRPFFRLLATFRFLRGTPWDPFGHTEVRRVERQLIGEYRMAIEAVAAALSPHNHELTIEIAALPDIVRGYEDIKLANVDRYHTMLTDAMSRLTGPATADRGGLR